MKRRMLVIVSSLVTVIAGCTKEVGTGPQDAVPGGLNPLIADGNHSAGNPDFFFLEPMVADPRHKPAFNKGQFNAKLKPEVIICSVGAAITNACGAEVHYSGSQVTLHLENDPLNDENFWYQVNWQVPINSTVYYRIRVTVGTTELGSADVKTGSKSSSNTNDYAFQKDGSTLPIKFRIENRALCTPAGVYSPSAVCASATVDLGTGGTVTTTLGGSPAGVNIPGQGGGGPLTVTLAPCPLGELNDHAEDKRGSKAIDLPVFGSCLSITTDHPLETALNPEATVFVCDAPPEAETAGLPEGQYDLITLHRYHFDGEGVVLEALPHAAACLPPPAPTVQSVLSQLRQGNWKAAGRAFARLIGPQELNALHLGGGGKVGGFSDFQFALPAKMEIVSGDGVTAAAGTTIDAVVKVTDLFDNPVKGARVHFNAAAGVHNGSISDSKVTDITGTPTVGPGIISYLLAPGENHRYATGNGIADPLVNGPREGEDPRAFDPFIPLDLVGPAVTLQLGMLTFTAWGVTGVQSNQNEGGYGAEFGFGGQTGRLKFIANQGTSGELGVLDWKYGPLDGLLFAFSGNIISATKDEGGVWALLVDITEVTAKSGTTISDACTITFFVKDGTPDMVMGWTWGTEVGEGYDCRYGSVLESFTLTAGFINEF